MYAVAKRTFDVLASAAAIVVLFPILLIVFVVVRVESKGGAIYYGKRMGVGGQPFKIFKFRTMSANAEQMGGPSTAMNDPRLTRVGRLLRKYKIDELPQLFNILNGTMSFVGPRPQVEFYTDRYSEEEQQILTVRPGLTDFASIHFIDMDETLGGEDVDEKYATEIEPLKNRLRLKYVRERSAWVDTQLLFMTFLALFGFRKKWNTGDYRENK